MKGVALSIFPGIDLLGRAFEEAGWCVVRGPDVIWGGDIHSFHPPAGVFDGIIGGDPCQSHSALVHLVRHNGNEPKFPDMSPEFQRVIEEAQPRWWVRENVPAAPKIAPAGYDVWSMQLVDYHVGGSQPRQRLTQFGLREGLWQGGVRSPLSMIEYGEGVATAHILAGPDANLPRLQASTDAYRRKLEEATLLGGNRTMRQNWETWERSVVADARQGSTGSRVRREGDGGGVLPHMGAVLPIEDACEAMGLPRDFTEHMPFTMHGKRSVLGNGVPMAMGRAVAAMVERALQRCEASVEVLE